MVALPTLMILCVCVAAEHVPPSVRLVDVTQAAGIDFVQTIGDPTMSNIVEATGVGCGVLDYDGDGWMDIYLISGCWLDGLSDPKLAPAERKRLAAATDRLYRNRGDGTFEDVTVQAGLAQAAYGMGVVAADYDGDGHTDIYVTNYGRNFLYRNNGDGTFRDVADRAGVADAAFSVGAVFLDYNTDGHLDLYVGNYLTYIADPTAAHTPAGVRSPLAYAGQQDRLYRGNADGTFTDVTSTAGIDIQPTGRAMGVGALDYDADSHPDIFVSNDAMENFLLHNRGDGTFENVALFSGVAFAEAGDAAAAMAAEIGDYDADGRLDILVPDMNQCCLYRNMGGGLFEDVATRIGLSAMVTRCDNWGGVLADFDNDGHTDIYITGGSAWTLEAHQDLLLVNNGRNGFTSVVTESGGPIANQPKPYVGRGVARADFDNDGDVDLLAVNLNAAPMLLRNDTPRGGRHWLAVRLVGRSPNRDAIGTTVRVVVGGRTLLQQRLSGGSYLSQHDSRLHFGLGGHVRVERVEVVWPDGAITRREGVQTDRFLTILQPSKSPGERD